MDERGMKMITKLSVIMSLIVSSSICCLAQKESLLIGPGDGITIQVLEAPELTQHVRVTDSGSVPLIVGGSIKVDGLTPSKAAEAVTQALKSGDYLLNPHVTVTVDQYATANVTVMGQVKQPGAYPIGTPRSVIDVLALAGGATDLADRRVAVERHGSKERVEYFLSNHSTTALDTNALVYPGDIVLVPKAEVVYVMGDVPKPGGYPMATNDGKLSVLQAVTLAGSQEPSAWPNSARLIRKLPDGTYVQTQVALTKMSKGKVPDIPLQPDDIIYIPFSFLRNMATNLSSIVAAAASATIYHY
jgi:polysaccharide export outer membrane protein